VLKVSDLANGVRKLQKLSKDMSDLDFKEQIVDLRTLLNEAQEAILEVEEEKRKLKSEIQELNATLAYSKSLMTVEGWKYRTDDDGYPIGLPFCPTCEINHKKFFQIVNPTVRMDSPECPNCKTVYGRSAKRLTVPT